MRTRLCYVILALLHATNLYGRTFTTKNGSTFDAEVIGAYATILYVDMGEGKSGSIDIRALSKADIEYVVQWAADYEAIRNNLPLVKDSTSELTKFLKDNLYYMEGDKLKKYGFGEKQEPEFYAFYSSASWCGPCRQFSPRLVNFYLMQKDLLKRENFEIILLSSDDGTSSMRKYMQEEKMKWPTVKHSKARAKIFQKFRGNGIPCLVVTDRNGNVLKHTYVNGKYEGPTKTMAYLKDLLNLTNPISDEDLVSSSK